MREYIVTCYHSDTHPRRFFPSFQFERVENFSVFKSLVDSALEGRSNQSIKALSRRTKASNFLSLTCPRSPVTRSLCFYFQTRFAHLFRRYQHTIFVRIDGKGVERCFISWSWITSLMNKPMLGSNKKWEKSSWAELGAEMNDLSFDIYLYNALKCWGAVDSFSP